MQKSNPYAIPATYHNQPSDFMKTLADVCVSEGCVQVSADVMYREIFPEDTIQPKEARGTNEDGHRGNPLLLIQREHNGKVCHNKRILFNDYEYLHKWKEIDGVKHIWLSGLTYLGKKRTLDRAVTMHALIFDIDYMSVDGLTTLFFQAGHEVIPMPNYIVLSGSGIHAYYLLEEPLPLYHGSFGRTVKSQLNELKTELTKLLWNPFIVGREHSKAPQIQGINQPFRLVGSYTKSLDKLHNRYMCVAYKTNAHPYRLERLYDWTQIPEERRYKSASIHGVDYWKEKNPEWYERRIVKKDKSIKYWHVNRRVYDWWLRMVREHATFGHRYNCLFCLMVFAVKCGVDKEELEKDMIELLPGLSELRPGDPITLEDVREACSSYNPILNTFPAASIQYLSGIDITSNKTRRNGRKQEEHLKGARALEQIYNPDWRNKEGAPTKEELVKEWRMAHPDGTMYRCAKETGMSKNTVKKWWKGE